MKNSLKIRNKIREVQCAAFEKMGETGSEEYWDEATKEQIFEFGRFRATEDILDFALRGPSHNCKIFALIDE